MDPAAMLIGTYQIQRRRPLQVFAFFQNEAVRRSGIKPDVEDVEDLLVVVRIVIVAKEPRRIRREPGMSTLLVNCLRNPVLNRLVRQNLSGLLFHKNRDRHAPRPLP